MDDELAGELQHSKGLYEEFNPSELRLNVGDYGQGTSRENEEENPCDENESGEEEFLDENETNEEEFLDENEITDEEELMSDYESNEDDRIVVCLLSYRCFSVEPYYLFTFLVTISKLNKHILVI